MNPVYPATCRQCGWEFPGCPEVDKIQILLAVAFLATVPNLATRATTEMLGVAAVVVIALVKLLGPMARRYPGDDK